MIQPACRPLQDILRPTDISQILRRWAHEDRSFMLKVMTHWFTIPPRSRQTVLLGQLPWLRWR
jgi:hypothetical protein